MDEREYWTNLPHPVSSYESLGLSPQLLTNLLSCELPTPHPLLQIAFPALLSHHPLLCQTLFSSLRLTAYSLPLLHHILPSDLSLQGIIVCPTREFAYNVSTYLTNHLAANTNIRIFTFVGGTNIQESIKSIKNGVHILVATPGRLLFSIQKRIISMENVKFMALEEADELFSRGFSDQISEILKEIPENTQKVAVFEVFCEELKLLNIENEVKIYPKPKICIETDQKYSLNVSESDKFATLLEVLDRFYEFPALIYCKNDESVLNLLNLMLEAGKRVGAVMKKMGYYGENSTLRDESNEAVIVVGTGKVPEGRFRLIVHYEEVEEMVFRRSTQRYVSVTACISTVYPLILTLFPCPRLPVLPCSLSFPPSWSSSLLSLIQSRPHYYLPVPHSKPSSLLSLVSSTFPAQILVCLHSSSTIESLLPSLSLYPTVILDRPYDYHDIPSPSISFLIYSKQRWDYPSGFDMTVIYDLPWSCGDYLQQGIDGKTVMVSLVGEKEGRWVQEMREVAGIQMEVWTGLKEKEGN